MSKQTKNIIVLFGILAAFAVLLLFGKDLFFAQSEETPENDAESVKSTDSLVINEVVTASRASLVIQDGSAPDWIELYNASNSSVSLSGMTLTDDPERPDQFALPSVSIGAGEYLVILCDNSDADDGYIHASFRLSSDGDYIGLYRGTTELLSLDIPALGKDISYGLSADGSYKYFGTATPGAENSAICADTADLSALANTLITDALILNEYQFANRNTIMDADGEHHPWVEVKNAGSETISLSGYALSDNIANLGKWYFPEELTLEPGESALVFLSAKNRTSDELHTSFSLGVEDTCIALSKDGFGLVDLTAVDSSLPEDCSYGRTANEYWAYFPAPTPGAANLTKSFAHIDYAEDKYLPDV